MVQDTPTTNNREMTQRERRQARKALTGEAVDPLAAGTALARVGGFYEGGLGRLAQYDTADGQGRTYTTPEMQESLARYKQIAGQYAEGGRTSDVQGVMDRMKGGLDGYNSAELQGQREQMGRGLDTQLKTGLAQSRISQARGGVRGASAAAQDQNLVRQRLATQGDVEQDIFVRNADEMQRRLGVYSDTVRGVEGDEYGRKIQTQTAYTNALAGQETANRASSQYDLDRLMAERSGALSSVLTTQDLSNQREQFQQKLHLWKQAAQRGRSGPAL